MILLIINSLVLFLISLLFITRAEAWDGTDPEQLKDYTAYVGQHEGVSVSLIQGIIKAESGFNPNARNKSSSASGVLQFINQTFKDYYIDKYHVAESMAQKNNPFIQINCAIEMLKDPKGYKHWLPSIAGWGHLLT